MVRYNQSGYCGQSRSVRAEIAEDEGKLPLSRAIGEVSREAGVTRKLARERLLSIGPCEWHHTGKFANRTDYYDVGHAIDSFGPLFEEEQEVLSVEQYAVGWLWLAERGSHHIDPAIVGSRIQHASNFRLWENRLRALA